MNGGERGVRKDREQGEREEETRPTPSPRSLPHRTPAAGPRPIETLAAPVRQFRCEHYDDCLDTAVYAGWQSWFCDGCEAYVEASLERMAHDVAGLLQIWAEATGESVIDGNGATGARPGRR